METADILSQVLEELDREMRRRHRTLFRTVDRLKASPGWVPWWHRTDNTGRVPWNASWRQ